MAEEIRGSDVEESTFSPKSASPRGKRAPRGPRARKSVPSAEKAAVAEAVPKNGDSPAAGDSAPAPVRESKPAEPEKESVKETSRGDDEGREQSRPDSDRGREKHDDDSGGRGFRKRFKKGRFKGGGGGKYSEKNKGPHWKQPVVSVEMAALGELPDSARYANLDELATRATEIADDGEPLFLDDIARMVQAELVTACREREIAVVDNPGRTKLIENLIAWATENRRPLIDRGHLDLSNDGHGFVVHTASNYRLLPDSTYVPAAYIRKHGLKRGIEIEVQAEPASEGVRCPAALVVRSAMGGPPDDAAKVVPFEELVPYYPTSRILLEVPESDAPKKVDVSMRCVDILTPIGFGQRGLIVAPPRTGKTIILQGLAHSVASNFPEAKLIVLLVDERPEEVTDFRRRVKGEVVSSTFDESPENHVHAAEMVGEKARRLVEQGKDVVILLDSITRLARAYNALASNSGKIMSGGVEATALQKPKRFFGAARNIEGGGSLTVMGTALIDTNSRMDEVIFEEFKGTGNMELHLDRDLVNKRIFPSINFERSGTRKEELLYHPEELQKIYGLRRIMLGVPAYEAMEMLIQRLKKTKSNPEFLLSLSR